MSAVKQSYRETDQDITRIRQPKRNPHHVLLQQILNDLQGEPSVWPFAKPVDSNTVADYYNVITDPMG